MNYHLERRGRVRLSTFCRGYHDHDHRHVSHIAACRYLSGNIGAQGCALAFFSSPYPAPASPTKQPGGLFPSPSPSRFSLGFFFLPCTKKQRAGRQKGRRFLPLCHPARPLHASSPSPHHHQPQSTSLLLRLRLRRRLSGQTSTATSRTSVSVSALTRNRAVSLGVIVGGATTTAAAPACSPPPPLPPPEDPTLQPPSPPPPPHHPTTTTATTRRRPLRLLHDRTEHVLRADLLGVKSS